MYEYFCPPGVATFSLKGESSGTMHVTGYFNRSPASRCDVSVYYLWSIIDCNEGDSPLATQLAGRVIKERFLLESVQMNCLHSKNYARLGSSSNIPLTLRRCVGVENGSL